MGQDVEEGRLVGGRYRLAGVLGRGGMGTVWRGRDETLGRPVAVKELRFPSSVDEDEKQRLITRTRREAKAIARIRSGSAVTVFDVVDEDDRPWIVMELVEGCSLAHRIRTEGPLTPKRAAEVGLAVLDVLRAAHGEGILHRDVKPSNVLLEEDTERVVLTDFGIAKVEGDPSITSTGMLVGAPSYISPERARGKPPGPPADLWSLGGLLYAAVEGHAPYDKTSALSTLTAVMTEPLPAPQKAGELAEVLYGLLEKNPEKRLDVDGAHALLEAVASGTAAVPAAPDATRTVPLPPAPDEDDAAGARGSSRRPKAAMRGRNPSSSGGSGTRSAERRLRGALQSVRNAAAGAGLQGATAGAAEARTDTGAGASRGAAGAVDEAAEAAEADEAAAGEPDEAAARPDAAAQPRDEADGSRTDAVAAGAGGPAPAVQGGKGLASLRAAASRRVPAVAAAVVALLLVVGAVLILGDDGDGGGGGTAQGGTSAGKAPGGNDSANDGSAQEDGKGDGEGRDGVDPAPEPGASEAGESGDDEQSGDGGLPAGYTMVEDAQFHFAVAMPEGFERVRVAGRNSGAEYARSPGALPSIQIDYTSDPGDDAVAAWEAGEEATRKLSTDYERNSIEEIEWRGYPTVADWDFERTIDEKRGPGERRVRVLNRGFKVDDGQGNSILVTCRTDAWDGEACRTLRETAFRTFQPR
jgi:eukaryotic-like serine/threonine-protein kinase